MASEKSFEGVPPFPDGLRVADLPAISLAKLSAQDVAEEKLLFNASRDLGFFILDLKDSVVGQEMTKEIDHLFKATLDAFDLPLEEKLKYHQQVPKSFLGYKGRGEIVTEEGKPERHEMFTVGYDEMIGNEPPHAHVPPLERERPSMRKLLQNGHTVLELILSALERQMELAPGTLQALHAADKPTNTMMRTILYGASIADQDVRTSMRPHTDWGSVSLLSSLSGGLQVLRPGFDVADEQGWEWVRPRPGCLIVNMADAMVEWTGGLLRSNMHRVNASPGQQRYVNRQSIVIVFRPNKEAPMQRLVGGLIPAVESGARAGTAQGFDPVKLTAFEWEQKKALAMIAGQDINTGRGGREIRV